MSSHHSTFPARFLALALAASLGGWILSSGCGGGGSAASGAATVTTDQANTVGTAAVGLALQAMTDSLAAAQASPSISAGKGYYKTPSGSAAISIGSLTLAAASSCTAASTTPVCDTPTRTVDVSIAGTASGECAGTVTVCDTKNYVSLTCTNYSTGTASLDGTVSFEMNNDTCDPTSSVAADLSTSVDGASCPISLSLATVKTGELLNTTGCFTVCGSGFEFTTSVSASDISTCASGSCVDDLTQLALLFSGTSCTYAGGQPTADSTFSHDVLLGANVDAADRQCLLYAACNTYGESSCMSYTTFEATAEACGVSLGGIGECQAVGGPCTINAVSFLDGSGSSALSNGDSVTINTVNPDQSLQFIMPLAPDRNLVSQSCVICSIDAGFEEAYEIGCVDGAHATVPVNAVLFKEAGFRPGCWSNPTATSFNTAFKVRYKMLDGSAIDTGTTIGLTLTLENL